MLNNIKYYKAYSKNLLRAFKIANLKASKALSSSSSSIATWIYKIHAYFELIIIKEIQTTKSRISISFNR